MTIKIKGNKIILSEAPKNNIPGAFLVLPNNGAFKIIDAEILQKEYIIPGELTKKDINSVYLRVL